MSTLTECRSGVGDYTYVSRARTIAVNFNVAILAVDEGTEHLRHSGETSLRVLWDEAACERKMDGRERREAERLSRRHGTDVDILEEILERDRRQLYSDLRWLRDGVVSTTIGKERLIQLTLVTLVSSVRWIPPAGSLLGKSKLLIFTPPFRLSMPFKVTFFSLSAMPVTSIPIAETASITCESSPFELKARRRTHQ